MNSNILKYLLIIFIIMPIATAIDFSPQGNISLKNRYTIIDWNLTSCSSGNHYSGYTDAGFTCSADVGGGSSQWTIDNIYLNNVSNVLTFNETLLNATIDSRSSSVGFSTDQNDELNTTGSPTFVHVNATLNWTDLQNYPGECTSGSAVRIIGDTLTCTTSINTATNWDGETSQANLNVNSSDYWDNLNSPSDLSNLTTPYCGNITGAISNLCTITNTGTNTHVAGDGTYLYNDSTTMYLNDTLLNVTIDARNTDTTYTAGSNLSLIGTVFSLDIISLQAYLDTIYQAVGNYVTTTFLTTGYYNKTDTDDRYLQSFTESDPVFVAENSSIYSAINLKLDITDQRYNDTTAIDLKLDITDQRYNNTVAIELVDSRVDSLNTTKLDATDQRYNDTSAIDLKLDITDQRYNDTAALDLKLDADDQRYNDTTAIDLKLDITDQRYNDTAYVDTSLTSYYTASDSVSYFVNRSLWTSIDNYPTACPAGEFVSSVGDTLTCAVPSGNGTTYTAGDGIQLVTSEFSIDATTCLSGNYSYWNGTDWLCDAPAGGATCGTTGTCSDVYTDRYLYHAGDSNTYVNFQTDDIQFQAGGAFFMRMMESTQDVLWLNGGNQDINLQYDGDANDNLLFCDASTEKCGIGTATPNQKLQVVGAINSTTLYVSSHFIIDTVNITCFNAECTFYMNATSGCQVFPSGGSICSGS